MIIGLTGKNASGKGEVLNFLKERSFYTYSLSDIIRDEIKKEKLDVTRDNLLAFGLKLREDFGNGVLAEKIMEWVESDKNYCIDSFRNPAEVAVFKRRKDFILVAVEADSKIRFERIKSRGRENDPSTFEEFQLLEKKEADSENASSQLLDKTISLADYKLPNDKDLESMHKKMVSIIHDATKKMPRPGWDEYFMKIAKEVASRSNCIKRKVAAVIVKDKRIISTGYNGTPRGVKNCNEGGCPRCYSFATAGHSLDKCLCSHAEENSITQAAYHGVSVKDATIYTTFSPCLMCTKMIINSGIKEVVYDARYSLDDTSFNLLREAGVKVRKLQSV